MKKLTWVLFGILILTAAAGPQAPATAAEAPPLQVNAKSAVLMEVSTGQILLAQNADVPLPPASVTKLMVLLLAMEEVGKGRLPLDEKIAATPEAARQGGSQIWLEAGEEMTVSDLLKAVAIVSANDACHALGERIAGSADAFVVMMNQRAQELKLKSTHFVNCTGLDPDDPSSEGNRTSAMDVAMMSRELLKHPAVLKWTGTWIDHLRDGKSFLRNTNKLVRFYAGCDGLKTGFTDKAGFCLTATAQRNHIRLIAVVMNSPTGDMRAREISRMFNWGFSQFQAVPVIKKGDLVAAIPVRRGVLENVTVQAAEDCFVPTKRGARPEFAQRVKVRRTATAPVQKGQEMGFLEVSRGDRILAKVPLVASTTVERANFGQLIGQVARHLFTRLFGK